MIHHSTWLGGTRAMRWPRLTAALGFLLACVLLAGFASTASAATYDMRGEWSIELTASKQPPLPGKDVIDKMEAGGEFSGKAVFGPGLPATVSGTVSGSQTSITVIAATPGGTVTFIAPEATIEVAKNSFAGPGTYYKEGKAFETGAVTATRIKTYQEVQEREARELKERQEKEARELKERQEKEAKEAKERQEKEAIEKKEKETREAAERTAREQKERELKERQAREAAEKAVIKTTQGGNQGGTTLLTVELTTKTLTVGHGGTISLDLTNPNGSPVHGHLKLTIAKAGKTSSTKHPTANGKNSTLGEVSFSISSHGAEVVKVKLSQSRRAQLARRKTLHVLVTLTTQASGQPDASKAFSLTLHAPGSAHRKG